MSEEEKIEQDWAKKQEEELNAVLNGGDIKEESSSESLLDPLDSLDNAIETMMETTEDLTSNNQEEKSIEDILADAEPEPVAEEPEDDLSFLTEENNEPEVEAEPEDEK